MDVSLVDNDARTMRDALDEACSDAELVRVAVAFARGSGPDAAHILPDRDERGHPEVPNGVPLCKIHHAAFDTNILGISPDYRIAIRADVLEETDGPMLVHGLQETHHRQIRVPGSERLRPSRDYLAERFERLRAA